MPTLARLNNADAGEAYLECAYNRDIEAPVDASTVFFVLSEEAHKKHDVEYDNGEMLIYSPKFKPEVEGYDLDGAVPWVAQTIDFDFSAL